MCFTQLQQLECSENKISDLIVLEMCNSLQFINIRKNKVESEENLIFIFALPELINLNISCNPVTKILNYPGLKKLYLSHIKILQD
jgi:Leucine-rich repeat (LRR) protein